MAVVNPDPRLCDLIRDAYAPTYNLGWSDHPKFKWSDQNQVPQPQPQAHNHPNQHQPQGVGNHAYWPPHQRGFQPGFPPQNEGQGQFYHPPKQQRTLEEMMGDLITSQQFMRNNLQASNDVFHKLQDAQWDQKVSIDILARQVTQLARSINDMHENGGGIRAQMQPPRKETLNQITLRSGKELKASFNKNSNNGQGETSEQGARLPSAAHCPSQETAQVEYTEDSDEEMDEHIIIPPDGPTPISMRQELDKNDIENGNTLDINDQMVQEFLEIEFLQDSHPTPSIEEQAELEELRQSKLFGAQGLSDEEIEEEIMAWCRKPEFTGSAENCKLPPRDGLPCQPGLPSLRTKENLLSSDVRPPELELKALPPNLKYVEENDTIPMIINSSLDNSQENELIIVLKRYKEVISWILANDIMSISPDVCMFYMSSEKGSKLYRDPKRKLNASTWKDWNARFDEPFSKEHTHAAQFVEQDSLDATVGKVAEAEAEGATKPTHESGIEPEEAAAPASPPPAKPARTPRIDLFSIFLLCVVYMCCVS